MIAVIDYGMGNLRSVQKAFEYLGFDAAIVEHPAEARGASHLVLPGDAAFGDAMRNIRERGWDEFLLREVEAGKPFLGICVGLQLMFAESEERGHHRGLSMLPGRVVRFPSGERVPQIGWNQIAIKKEDDLLDGVPEGSFFYFVHSYYVDCEESSDCLATTDYGLDLHLDSCSRQHVGSAVPSRKKPACRFETAAQLRSRQLTDACQTDHTLPRRKERPQRSRGEVLRRPGRRRPRRTGDALRRRRRRRTGLLRYHGIR